MFPGEWSGLEEFQRVLNGLLPHQLSKCHARVVDPRENLSKFIPGVFEDWASPDDMVAGLKGGWVVVCVLTRTLEE